MSEKKSDIPEDGENVEDVAEDTSLQDAQEEAEQTEKVEETEEESKKDETPQNYEFSHDEEMIFEEFASRVGFVAKIMMVAAFIGVIRTIFVYQSQGVLAAIYTFALLGVVCFLVGLYHFRAGKAFRRIVNTEGNDINLLMSAIESLRQYYRIFYCAAVIAIVATFVIMTVTVLNKIT